MPKIHKSNPMRPGYTMCGVIDSFRGLTGGLCARCFPSNRLSQSPKLSNYQAPTSVADKLAELNKERLGFDAELKRSQDEFTAKLSQYRKELEQ